MINRLALRTEQVAEPRENTDSAVFRILEYINEHYQEDLSLDDLANRFFISKYHLSREFNRIVGTSVYRYIIQKRLIMARQMMAAGTSTSEVSQLCGFGDYSNFYRAFTNEYQISPRKYLEELKKEPPRHQDIALLLDRE
jgi:AraC-like DNA-binding protein